MTTTAGELEKIEMQKTAVFEGIVKRVAEEHNVPLSADATAGVRKEIEFAVKSLLVNGNWLMAGVSPEIDMMVERWRRLDREAQIHRPMRRWENRRKAHESGPLLAVV